MAQDATTAARPRRRWLQFKLRTLLVLMLVAALPLWAFTSRLQKVRRQRRAAAAVNAAGGDVWFADDPDDQNAATTKAGAANYVFRSRRRALQASTIPFDSQESTREGNPLSRLVSEARSGEPVAVDFSGLRFRLPAHAQHGVAKLDLGDEIDPHWREQFSTQDPRTAEGDVYRLPWHDLTVLSELQVLCLADVPIENEDLLHLGDLPLLRCLIARDASRITDKGLAAIGRLHELRILSLSGSKITDDGLRNLSALTRLEVLELDHAPIRGPGLAHLHPLRNLKLLSLRFTTLRDDGLVYLSSLTSLKRLYFFQTRVTDAGLEHLKPLTSLEILHLGKTGITFAGADAFERDLPRRPIIR